MGLQNVGVILSPKVTPTPTIKKYSEKDLNTIIGLLRHYAKNKLVPPESLEYLLNEVIKDFDLNILFHRKLLRYPSLIRNLRMKNEPEPAEDDTPSTSPLPGSPAPVPQFNVNSELMFG